MAGHSLLTGGNDLAMAAQGHAGAPSVERGRLPNGLEVVVRRRQDAETVALNLLVRAGSRFESDHCSGASNFVQRMFTQGTPTRPDRDAVMGTVTSRGGTLDVSNSLEFVEFLVALAPEDFELGLELLTDLLANSTFASDRIEHQRQLILSELALRRDNPSARAFDLFHTHVFANHPLKYLPTGDVTGTVRMTREHLLEFRRQRFTPPTMVLGVVGPFSSDQVSSALESTLGTLEAGAVVEDAGAPPPTAVAREVQYAAGRDQAMVLIGAPTVGLKHPDRYPLWLLQAILGPSGGRLFYDIRDARGLAYDTNVRLASTADCGSIIAYAGTDPANVELVSGLLFSHFDRVRSERVTPVELANAVGYIVGGTTVGTEQGTAQASHLVRSAALGLPIEIAELEANLQAVSTGDVHQVAVQYLAPERLTRVVVAPGSRVWQ